MPTSSRRQRSSSRPRSTPRCRQRSRPRRLSRQPQRRPQRRPPLRAPVDITAELQKLAALKEQGLIDDAEFTAMKAKVLGL